MADQGRDLLGIITRQAIRRGTFTDVSELQTTISNQSKRATQEAGHQVLVRITISAASCAVESAALRLPSSSTTRYSP